MAGGEERGGGDDDGIIFQIRSVETYFTCAASVSSSFKNFISCLFIFIGTSFGVRLIWGQDFGMG